MVEHEEQAAVKSASNPEAAVRADLEKRLYHLRTLHDFSREIFTVSREKDILRSFLLMTMGTFGVTRGMVTNVAARIGALAAGGAIHLSESTADRVRGQHAVRPKGKFDLKNVSQKVEIFTLDH